jgi:tetratricopeptide (TPR) repeat protein
MTPRESDPTGRRVSSPGPTISACLIVRDEEARLADCLASIRNWVDEIIVVDTGSADRTLEIARQFDVRVFELPWRDDFSAARNYSIDQATGDWIFIIDADERFDESDLALVLDPIRADRFAVLAMDVFNEYGDSDTRRTYSNSIRFFKRNLGLRYEGIVHNALNLPPDLPVLRTSARLRHLGYGLSKAEMKRKYARTHSLLRRQLDKNPDDVFALFNYAELLRGANPEVSTEHALEIERAAGRVLELVPGDDPHRGHLHLMCLNQLTATFISRKNLTRAREYCQRALDIRFDYLDGLIHLGMIEYGDRNYRAAVEAFERYLEAQRVYRSVDEAGPIILTYPMSRDLAHNNLGNLYTLLADTEKARLHYIAALETNPRFGQTAVSLGRLFLAEGDWTRAERFFNHQLDYSGPNLEARLGLAAAAENDGREEAAREQLEKSILEFPDSPVPRLELGRMFLRQRRDDEALAVLTEVLAGAKEPGNIEARIADNCFEMERFDLARQYYELALERTEPDYDLFNNLGNCFFKLGNWSEAEAQYLRSIRISPDLAPAHRNLGLTMARQNRLGEALESLANYLALEPEDYRVRRLAGDLARESGDFRAAITYYERVLDQAGVDEAALLGLSESYFLAGHKDAALKGYRQLLEVNPAVKLARHRVRELSEALPPV